MFDMRKIGKRISELRRAKNITQTALADMLGISFQAVSNWERGESMPDISKLGDLSRIFGVSIDDILCNPRAARIVEEISAGEAPKDMTVEELTETAPIMSPEQAQENIEDKIDCMSLSQLSELAFFLSSETLAELVRRCLDNGAAAEELSEIAPFMDNDELGCIILEKVNEGWTFSDISELAPFMKESDIEKAALRLIHSGAPVDDIGEIAPFLNSDSLGRIAAEVCKVKRSADILEEFLPFIDEKNLVSVIRNIMK